MNWGRPYGVPGEVYHYPTTGYILLGEVLERLTALPLGAALRQLINYHGLGLTSTWLESLEEPPPWGPGTRPSGSMLAEPRSRRTRPSKGYGASGLVSTMGDLARFIRGVFTDGGVCQHDKTIDTMLTTIAAKRGGPAAYGQPQIPGIYPHGGSL